MPEPVQVWTEFHIELPARSGSSHGSVCIQHLFPGMHFWTPSHKMLNFPFQYSTAELSGITEWMKPDKNQTRIMTILIWVFSALKSFRKKGKAWISAEQHHLWRVCWSGSLCFPELLDSQALLPSPSRKSLHASKVGFKAGLKHTLQRGEDQEGASAMERGLRGMDTALSQLL